MNPWDIVTTIIGWGCVTVLLVVIMTAIFLLGMIIPELVKDWRWNRKMKKAQRNR